MKRVKPTRPAAFVFASLLGGMAILAAGQENTPKAISAPETPILGARLNLSF